MKPKVLVYDIESGFNVAATFNLFPERIPIQQILQERYMICAAWKFLGEEKTYSVSLLNDPKRFKKDPTDDFHVVKKLHEVLSGVDAVVAHYGDKFDIKMFNSRAIYHNLPPLPDLVQIDTYKIAKQKFLFNSNKLDYLGQYLGLGKKLRTSVDLWLGCLRGERKAVKDMVTYNIQDVDLLEQVYLKLAPYVPAKLNMNLFGGDGCPLCGSDNYFKNGTRRTKTQAYQRYLCHDCGHSFRGRDSLLKSKVEHL